ncbi:MAG: hypothetical protein R3A80_00010 [Bdellovibrionota bacterium]
MKKGFLLLGLFTLMAHAIQIDLGDGDIVEINPNRVTTVTCSAEGGGGNADPVSCTEECEKWYSLNEYINYQWQVISHCASRSKCETEGRCIKKTTCERFQTTNEYLYNQWQDVAKCVGTKSSLTCN